MVILFMRKKCRNNMSFQVSRSEARQSHSSEREREREVSFSLFSGIMDEVRATSRWVANHASHVSIDYSGLSLAFLPAIMF